MSIYDKLQLALCGLMPPSFFKSRKVPVAPLYAANVALFFIYASAAAAFAALFNYYYQLTTPVTTISSTLLAGQTCTVLTPRRGTTFYSANNSENAQFASPFFTKDECISLLQKENQVCAASNRLDFLSVLGVSNPNNLQYFQSGYLTFTPSQTAGTKTELSTIYQPSVSFPRPVVSQQFAGSSTTWYVYSFARDSYLEYTDVSLSNSIIDSNYSGSTDNSEKLYLQNGLSSFIFAQDGVSYANNGSIFQGTTSKSSTKLLAINNDDYYTLEISALFSLPVGVAVDGSGNVYVADTLNNLVRRIDNVTGAVTNVGESASPSFNRPRGVAVDGSGNVYVADTYNNLVRRIDAVTGVVSNVGESASPAFNNPFGVAVDGSGNVYVADTYNSLVRRIDAVTGVVTNIGESASPAFNTPRGVAVDSSGKVYVADLGNGLVRRIDVLTGAVTNVGESASPAFNKLYGVAVDGSGNVFVADTYNNLVRRIDALTGVVTNIGESASPSLNTPQGVAVDSSGKVYVADTLNNLVRRIDPEVTNIGVSASPPYKNSIGVAVDGSGNVYVADTDNSLVRRIDFITGVVTNIGKSASPSFNSPRGVAVDGSGNVFVSDANNNLVRRIDAVTGVVTNIGVSASPAFNNPFGVAVDGSGNVYVADLGNSLVRRIDFTTGVVTNIGVSASFNNPYGVTVDGSGNVYVADTYNSLVRRIDAVTGVVINLPIGISASPAFNNPSGVAVDSYGNVYVADAGNNLIRRIDAVTGVVTSIGTSASPLFSSPDAVAVDGSGNNVYVADTYNNLVRVIRNSAGVLGKLWNPLAAIEPVKSTSDTFQVNFDVISSVPTVDRLYIMYSVDTNQDCESSYRPSSHIQCTNTIVFSLYSQRYHAMLTGFAYNSVLASGQFTRQPVYVAALRRPDSMKINTIPRNSSGPPPYVYFNSYRDVASIIVGVFDTPKGTILFTSYAPQPVSLLIGNISDLGIAKDLSNYYNNLNSTMIHLNDSYKNFIGLVRNASSVQSSVLPGTESSRYVSLQLVLASGGSLKTVTYDTFTDQYFTPTVPVHTAATKYMLAYSYGICDGTLTKSLVELSGSLDYSTLCTKQNGLYYQSPNVYYPLPQQCLSIPYDKLLTECPPIAANMASLVDTTCQQSIEKVCSTQYNDNPPYTCTTYTRSSILTVLSLSFSTTMAIIGVVGILLTICLTQIYPTHMTSNDLRHEKETVLVNTGLSKKDAIGVSHETVEGLMKFCDAASAKLGLETIHRQPSSQVIEKVEVHDEDDASHVHIDNNNDESMQSPTPLKPPKPSSSRATSSQSNTSSEPTSTASFVPIDITAEEDPSSHVGEADESGQSKKDAAVGNSYEVSKVGLMGFFGAVAVSLGMKPSHRVEAENNEQKQDGFKANGNETITSPPPRPPKPASSRGTSEEASNRGDIQKTSSSIPIDVGGVGSEAGKNTSSSIIREAVDESSTHHSSSSSSVELAESKDAQEMHAKYEPLEIGIPSDNFDNK